VTPARARRARALRRLAILGHAKRPGVAAAVRRALALAGRHGISATVLESPETAALRRSLAAARADLLVTLGGDGTILAGARAVAGTDIALLPVNLGGLGFLASAEGRGLVPALGAALAGEWRTVAHATLAARLRTSAGRRRDLGIAVNDAVLRQSPTFRAMRAALFLDGEPLGTLLADGLVVATPTGSTAYSLSAGGPILLEPLAAFVATPVCPHTLGSRSIVVSGDRVLEARVLSAEPGVSLSVDGLPGVPVARGESVEFALGRARVLFLRPPEGGVPAALRDKLSWQGSRKPRSP
jgi:NAD+ kinase